MAAAEHRVRGLLAALCCAAVVLVGLAPGGGDARGRGLPEPRLDKQCGLSSRGPVEGDARGGDALPSEWAGSPYLRPRGVVRAKMLFVDFSDATGAPVATEILRAGLVQRAKRWLAEVSYDSASLSVEGHHRWIRMPKPSTAYWPPGGVYRPADYLRDAIATADPEVDFGATDLVYIVPAPGSQIVLSPAYVEPVVRADGESLNRFVTLGQEIYDAAAGRGPSRLVQGTAHLFSLPYLDDPSQAGAPRQRWAGSWDPMGEPDLLSHPSAWSKRKLGWLEPGRSMVCIRRGVIRDQLVALSRHRGLRAVSIRLSARRRYVIEARQRHGFDADICSEGVLVWLIDGGKGSGEGPMRVQPARSDSDNPGRPCRELGVTGALDRAPLVAGHTFTDSRRGVVVEVKRNTRRGFRVRIERS